jgi:hypothetical protein
MHADVLPHLDINAVIIYEQKYAEEDSTLNNYSSLHLLLWNMILATFQTCPHTDIVRKATSLSYLARCLELLSRNTKSFDHTAADTIVESQSNPAIKRDGIITSADPHIKYNPPERTSCVANLYSLHRDATTRISNLARKLPTMDITSSGVINDQLDNIMEFDVTLSGVHNSYTDDLDIYMVLISKAKPVTTTSTCFKLDRSSLKHYKTFWQLASIPDNLCNLVYGIHRSPVQSKKDLTSSVKTKIDSFLKSRKVGAFKTGSELLKTIPVPEFPNVDPTTDHFSRKSNKGTKFKRGFCSPLPNV